MKLLPITAEMEALAAKDLDGFKPQGKRVRGGINRNGVYALSGDLFDSGQIYAVIDSDPIVVSRWEKNHWKPVAAIDQAAVWQSQEWKPDMNPAGPIAAKPFWIVKLQHRSLLVVASLPGRGAAQDYLVILFERQLSAIFDVACSYSNFRDAPAVKSGYLITQDRSRRLGEWEAHYFSRIVNGKFLRKSWRRNYYNPEDLDFYEAEADGKSYEFQEVDEENSDANVFVVRGGGPPEKSAVWEAEVDVRRTDFDIYPYLFTRLMGLPLSLYPNGEGFGVKGKVSAAGIVKVKGNPKAVKLLSP